MINNKKQPAKIFFVLHSIISSNDYQYEPDIDIKVYPFRHKADALNKVQQLLQKDKEQCKSTDEFPNPVKEYCLDNLELVQNKEEDFPTFYECKIIRKKVR